MPAPMMQTSTWTFSASGGHSASDAVADQNDWWRGMGMSSVIGTPVQKTLPARALGSALAPPAAELRLDRRGAVHLRERALFLRLLFFLPLRNQRVCLGEG